MNDQSQPLELFSTTGCHLCDEAETLLSTKEIAKLIRKHGLKVIKVDISESQQLFEQYGVHIPVLRLPSGRELYWPFDLISLEKFLN